MVRGVRGAPARLPDPTWGPGMPRAFSNPNRGVCSALGTPKLAPAGKHLTLIPPHGREVLGLGFRPGHVTSLVITYAWSWRRQGPPRTGRNQVVVTLCASCTPHNHVWRAAQGPGYAPGIRVTANQPTLLPLQELTVCLGGQPERRREVASYVATEGKAQRLMQVPRRGASGRDLVRLAR